MAKKKPRTLDINWNTIGLVLIGILVLAAVILLGQSGKLQFLKGAVNVAQEEDVSLACGLREATVRKDARVNARVSVRIGTPTSRLIITPYLDGAVLSNFTVTILRTTFTQAYWNTGIGKLDIEATKKLDQKIKTLVGACDSRNGAAQAYAKQLCYKPGVPTAEQECVSDESTITVSATNPDKTKKTVITNIFNSTVPNKSIYAAEFKSGFDCVYQITCKANPALAVSESPEVPEEVIDVPLNTPVLVSPTASFGF